MRILIPLVLLVMILTRLVWMQLRDYQAHANYRALVNQTRLVDEVPDRCRLNRTRSDSLMLKEFNEAKDVRSKAGYNWFHSPGYIAYARLGCQEGEFRPDNLVRLNQWLLVSFVALGVLILRMLTRSWTFAMIGAAVLLSRGHLLSLNGDVGPWALSSVVVMAWVCAMLHFFLTGSPIIFASSMIFLAIGCTIDPVFWTLGLALPTLLAGSLLFRRYLAVPVLQRFRAEQRKLKRLLRRGKLKVYDGSVLTGLALDLVDGLVGSRGKDRRLIYPNAFKKTGSLLFQTLKEPFTLWVLQKRRGIKINAVCIVTTVGLFVLAFFLQQGVNSANNPSIEWLFSGSELKMLWLSTFLEDVIALVDWHLGVSVMLIIICALQGPAVGLKGFFEFSWLIIIAYLVATCGAVAYDYVDFHVIRQLESSFGVWSMMVWSRSPQILIWFEPVFLITGMTAFYNLLVIINQRWADRKLRD